MRRSASMPTTAPRMSAATPPAAGSRCTLPPFAASAAECEVTLPMPGRFNVENALGALAAAHALGHELAVLVAALERGVRVPGRFEPVDEGQEFSVLVDYAHTPDSLENVLSAARELAEAEPGAGAGPRPRSAGAHGRVISVFGAGGDRDRGKRPQMGEISARLADLTIVTSDNPRSEQPQEIVAQIVAGVAPASAPSVQVEVDRRAAIDRAIAQAREGDVVVIAGKGHEQGQELAGGVKTPFDDVQVARAALRRRIGEPSARGRVRGRARGRRDRRMRDWDAERLARAAGAELVSGRAAGAEPVSGRAARGWALASGRTRPGPTGVSIDSRALASGELFVGLAGEHADGGRFAAQALAAGAWGVLVAPEHARAAAAAAESAERRAQAGREPQAAILVHPDPLAGLQELARAWLGELRSAGARVVAITGSTGKTSTKDILAALLARSLRVARSPENFNTEIGLPLAILAAPAGTEALVLEMAMRGPGQIAQLTRIAEPDVGVDPQRRPRPSRAARLARGGGGGQGGADRRPGRRRERRAARR